MPSILLVASAYAPSRLIGGRRAERIAAHLAQAGWRVTVVTLRPAYVRPTDAGIALPPGVEVLRTHAAMPRLWLNTLRARQAPGPTTPAADAKLAQPARNGMVRRAANRLLAPLEFPDEFAGWRPFALHALAGRRFDVVLVTMPPFSAAPLALQLAKRCGARLVLDYRDPWSELAEPQGLAPALARRHRRVEDACLRAASLIIGVTPSICAWLRQRTAVPVVLISNGFLARRDPPVPPSLPAGPRRLVYAGSLAYGRDLQPLLQAMAALRPAVGAETLRLQYAGSHGPELLAQAQKLGLADAVEDLGELSSAQALALLDGALAAIVVVSPGFSYAYPGKIFEILGRGCPLLALAPPDSDTARLVERHALGWSHAASDVTGLSATLRQALAGRAPIARDLDALRAETVMARLAEQLQQLVAAAH